MKGGLTMELPYYIVEMSLDEFRKIEGTMDCVIYCDINDFCEHNPYKFVWTDGEVVRTYKEKIVVLN